MARLGYFLWTIGSLNASTICSLVAKVTNDLPALGTSPCRWRKSAGCGRKLKMSGCEKRQNNQNLKLGVREESKAAIIPHNPDTSSRTPFNSKDKCGLNALNNKPLMKTHFLPLRDHLHGHTVQILLNQGEHQVSTFLSNLCDWFITFQHSSLISKILNIQQFIHH